MRNRNRLLVSFESGKKNRVDMNMRICWVRSYFRREKRQQQGGKEGKRERGLRSRVFFWRVRTRIYIRRGDLVFCEHGSLDLYSGYSTQTGPAGPHLLEGRSTLSFF